MTYSDPGCGYCPASVRACRQGESEERGPGFCPSKLAPEAIEAAFAGYADPETARIAKASALTESEGYCKWTRVEEICAFAKKMGYRKIGIACCISMVDLAGVLSRILESHGFQVASVACKTGGIAKERIGIKDGEKIRPGGHESICNPITQAALLERAGCEFNVVLGLCVGHDSLFFRASPTPCTVLIAKDRVLAHNPIGALQWAETYYSRVFGPAKPAVAPKSPAEGRRH